MPTEWGKIGTNNYGNRLVSGAVVSAIAEEVSHIVHVEVSERTYEAYQFSSSAFPMWEDDS